jgi:hypothetical protein
VPRSPRRPRLYGRRGERMVGERAEDVAAPGQQHQRNEGERAGEGEHHLTQHQGLGRPVRTARIRRRRLCVVRSASPVTTTPATRSSMIIGCLGREPIHRRLLYLINDTPTPSSAGLRPVGLGQQATVRRALEGDADLAGPAVDQAGSPTPPNMCGPGPPGAAADQQHADRATTASRQATQSRRCRCGLVRLAAPRGDHRREHEVEVAAGEVLKVCLDFLGGRQLRGEQLVADVPDSGRLQDRARA